jgi:hypothetical protein
MRPRTLAMRIVSRLTLISSGFGVPSRRMVSLTLLPASPRNGPWPSALAGVSGLPSTATMVSPDLMPARAAGVSSIGAMMRTLPSGSCCTSTPMPS